MSIFQRVRTTEEVARDSRHYEEDLSRHQGVIYYNADTDGLGFAQMSDRETADATKRLTAMQRLITALLREPIHHREIHKLRRLSVHASVAHLAARDGMAVWCDDAAARLVLRNIGIAAYSTVTVIEHLLVNGIIDAHRYREILDTFVRERIGNLELDLDRIVRIAREEQWQATSAAHCFSQPQAWLDLANTIEIVQRVLRMCHSANPSQLPAWLEAAILGATLQSDNTRAALEVGAILLAGNLIALDARGELARDMVQAARRAVKAGLPVDNPAHILTDPLVAAVGHMRSLLLADSSGPAEQIFPLILDILGELDSIDRQNVTEALLAKEN